jgi:hypothetical protein
MEKGKKCKENKVASFQNALETEGNLMIEKKTAEIQTVSVSHCELSL